MAEYNNWKVTDQKAELKRQGIPQTGLRLKQQIIEKLQEADGTEPEVAQGQKQEQKGASEMQEKPELKAPIEEAAKEADVEPPASGPTVDSQSQDVTTVEDGAPVPVPTNAMVKSITGQTPAPDEAPNEAPENPPSLKITEQSPETAGELMEQDTISPQSSASEATPAEGEQEESKEQEAPPKLSTLKATEGDQREPIDQDAPPQLTTPKATSLKLADLDDFFFCLFRGFPLDWIVIITSRWVDEKQGARTRQFNFFLPLIPRIHRLFQPIFHSHPGGLVPF